MAEKKHKNGLSGVKRPLWEEEKTFLPCIHGNTGIRHKAETFRHRSVFRYLPVSGVSGNRTISNILNRSGAYTAWGILAGITMLSPACT